MFVLFLILYIAVHSFDFLVTGLNIHYIGRHGEEVPEEFAGFIDTERLVSMKKYTLVKEKFGLLSGGFSMLVTAFFFFGGLLGWYENIVSGWQLPSFAGAMLFFLLLSWIATGIQIPFSLYSTFGIERRFGFNKQTIGLWLTDTLKSLVLSSILLAILLGAVLWLIQCVPEYWWLFSWGVFFLFSLFLLYISPYVIEPLFNTFKPVEDEELENTLEAMMEKAGLAISKVSVMDASRRSSHSNAYFSGIGRVKRIVLFDTLLTQCSHSEIGAILAHEAGHWKKKHVLKRLLMTELIALAGFYSAYLLVQSDWLAIIFSLNEASLPARLLLAGFLMSLVSPVLQPLTNYWSRCHERQADDFAVGLTGSPDTMAMALIKLGRDNLANLHPHPLYAAVNYGHPPLVERVRYLRRKG